MRIDICLCAGLSFSEPYEDYVSIQAVCCYYPCKNDQIRNSAKPVADLELLLDLKLSLF